MIPLSQTLLLASYPPALAGTAMAMWAMTTLVAPVAGPLLGGWITDNISWPWIFYINVPVGLLAAAMAWSIYRTRDPGRAGAARQRRPRPAGAVGRRAADHDRQGQELDWFASGQIVRWPSSRWWASRSSSPGSSPSTTRSSTCACSRGATSCSAPRAVGGLRPVLRQRWCCCRCGCSSTWATPPPGPAWRWRRWAVRHPALAAGGPRTSRVDPRKLATVAFVVFALVLWMRSGAVQPAVDLRPS